MASLASFVVFSRRRRHRRCLSDWSSDVCSSDLACLWRGLCAKAPVAIHGQRPGKQGAQKHRINFHTICHSPNITSALQLTGETSNASQITTSLVIPYPRRIKVVLTMKMLPTSISVFLLMGAIAAQTSAPSDPAASSATVSVESRKTTIIIPAGTSVPVSLKQAISTKTARNGDPVYAETAFQCVVNDHIVIPSGTYIQGKIERVQRGGHVKGRAEIGRAHV